MMTAAPAPTTNCPSHTALFAQRRAAIDLIATARARSIRCALFGAYLFRPNPLEPESEDTRAQWLCVLEEQVQALSRAAALVHGSDPEGVVPQEVCTWIGEHGARWRDHAGAFNKLRDLSRAVATAAKQDDPKLLQTALKDHFVFGRGGFFETANAAGTAITKTLTRLEHIGKHVRLVSLNASVEAARVGDAGRGLGVIAVEFKTLAEEIQMLATTARADIAAMTHVDDAAPKNRVRTHS